MEIDDLRQELRDFLGFRLPPSTVAYETHRTVKERDYTRARVSYPSPEGDRIPAFLLLPDGKGPFPAVLAHHQHNSQRHLGKSEICGLRGDPLQAFGPALAQRGILVLAPDSI